VAFSDDHAGDLLYRGHDPVGDAFFEHWPVSHERTSTGRAISGPLAVAARPDPNCTGDTRWAPHFAHVCTSTPQCSPNRALRRGKPQE
jgi:hypothetical protein